MRSDEERAAAKQYPGRRIVDDPGLLLEPDDLRMSQLEFGSESVALFAFDYLFDFSDSI